MKRHGIKLGILAALIIGSTSIVLAHEECDDDSATPAAAQTAEQRSTNVTIKLFQFKPGRLEVKTGTRVTWVNEDDIFHTVSAEKSESSFHGALEGKGKSFSFTFDRPGSFSYFCARHEHMRGVIVVR